MQSDLPDPSSAPELFEGVLTRRIFAYVVDVIVITMIAVIMSLAVFISGFLTLGLSWLTFPIIVPFSVFFYYVATLGSPRRATFGMQIFDLVLTPTEGPPLDGWKALVHPFVFWVTIWVFWPLLFVGLFTRRRQLIHDMISSTLMVRRSPMQRHWSRQEGFPAE